MAEALRDEVWRPSGITVGSQLIDVVTGGMYNDSLMVLREYVQNAVDSLDLAYSEGLLDIGEGRVDIEVDGINREVSVTDNGAGIRADEVTRLLCSLGCSTKDRRVSRGFRGIGRLGGLGYCDEVVFETRASAREPVSVVRWDGRKLQDNDGPGIHRDSAQDAVERCVTVAARGPVAGEPAHFFRSTMKNVRRFHRDDLMNLKSVASFLSRVAPVDFDERAFPFADEVRSHVRGVPGYRTYLVFLNGTPLYRPHRGDIEVAGKRVDRISRVELFALENQEGQEIGRGWYAITGFLSALPTEVEMRGIRLRQGNIEVGDEYSLASLYSERRFSTWHVGEVHLDYSVKANARRDSFEQSRNYQAVLEQLSVLCRRLSAICRESSTLRGKTKAAETALDRLEGLVRLKVIIDEEEIRRVVEQAEMRLRQLATVRGATAAVEPLRLRLNAAQETLEDQNSQQVQFGDLLDGRSLRFTDARKALRDIAKAVVTNYDGAMSRERLLSLVFAQYMKKGALDQLIQGD